MPVFARAKLIMEEYCFTLRPRMLLSYSGPHPEEVYPKVIDILVTTIRVPRENIQEKSFDWNRSAVPERFSISLEVIKDMDKFSYMRLDIVIRGTVKPSKEFEKEGSVSIDVEGMLRTEYPQDTRWERSFIYEMFRTFWHKVFYQDQRKKYIDNCRDLMFKLQTEMKEFLNILPKKR